MLNIPLGLPAFTRKVLAITGNNTPMDFYITDRLHRKKNFAILSGLENLFFFQKSCPGTFTGLTAEDPDLLHVNRVCCFRYPLP
jgi:hypothetical protein